MMNYHESVSAKAKIIDLAEEGILDWETIAREALEYMSSDCIQDMANQADWFYEFDEDNEVEAEDIKLPECNKKVYDYLIETFTDSLEENADEYSKEELKVFRNNIMLYWKSVFEQQDSKFERKRTPNLMERIDYYYRGLPTLCPEVFDNAKMEKMRDEWGFTTPLDVWINNFYPMLARKTIHLLNRYHVSYADLIF